MQKRHVPLYTLPQGERGRIVSVTGEEGFVRRLSDLGFVAGGTAICLWRHPLGDPAVYRVGDVSVALRLADASAVSVVPCDTQES